jgi:ribose transport system substrate-binding protein
MIGTPITRRISALAAAVVLVAACSGANPTTGPTQGTGASAPASQGTSTKGPYTIGYSNAGGVGNGFREEQVCTAKAEATALGKDKIAGINVIHRVTDAAGQLSDLRTLISQKVNALVFNPNDPDALNAALAEAHDAGIVTVSVDQYVTDPNTWNLYNNQVKYAELGAEWLFKQLNGKGTVWYTRGFAGAGADSDRDVGFNNMLKKYPGIKVINPGGTFTQWDIAIATQVTNDFIASGDYDRIDGMWASGMANWMLDAIAGAKKKFVPVADADIGGYVNKLLDPVKYPGLVGAAVTNTASVGGAGVNMAYKLLTGEKLQQTAGAGRPNTVLLDPQVLDNTTDKGKADLKAWVSVPGLDAAWPLSLAIPGWTDYDPNGVPASCKGA